MSRFQQIEDAVARDGLPEGETMETVIDDVRRALCRGIERRVKLRQDQAVAMGMSREGYVKLRKRLGLKPAGGQTPRPIPADFRDRLETSR